MTWTSAAPATDGDETPAGRASSRGCTSTSEVVAGRFVVIGGEGVRAGGLVVVIPRVVSTARGLTRFGRVAHLVLVAQQLFFVGAHTVNVRRRRTRATVPDAGYFGPPVTGSVPRRPGGPAVA